MKDFEPIEVAVELMSEEDFDQAMTQAYQAGSFDSGNPAETIRQIKRNLGLFRAPSDLQALAKEREVRRRFDEESG
jgi:hypothetical protein